MTPELTQQQIALVLATVSARVADPDAVTLPFLVALLELHNSPRAWTTSADPGDRYRADLWRHSELWRLFGYETAEAAREARLADIDPGA